jgi:probable H4MPT-linked C1 transfer pathway protein
VSVPFALWKQPDRLPAALAELVGQFPDAVEFAVTMTGELCDCFETKRQGVNAILDAVLNVSRSRPVRVWSTDGAFVNVEEARRDHLKVAAANWHATATFAGRYVPSGPAILVDVGSTTTDVIPILDGRPVPQGLTDYVRLYTFELVYTGVRRTPLCTILGFNGAAELFATTLDAYLLLGLIPEDPTDCDTADGRPATRPYARARVSRMLGGDAEVISEDTTTSIAEGVYEQQCDRLHYAVEHAMSRLERVMHDREIEPTLILSGAGEFLARHALRHRGTDQDRSLTETLGLEVSRCAPAYALAVLATERPA